jgi:hypothetical protein
MLEVVVSVNALPTSQEFFNSPQSVRLLQYQSLGGKNCSLSSA